MPESDYFAPTIRVGEDGMEHAQVFGPVDLRVAELVNPRFPPSIVAPGTRDLLAHARDNLNAVVAAAYGWLANLADGEVLTRVLATLPARSPQMG